MKEITTPDQSDEDYAAVAEAISLGCKPRKIYEMGEWHWWRCGCSDLRHSTDPDNTYCYGIIRNKT